MDIRKIGEVISIYKRAGYKAYLVGGSSRDLLFSADTNDIDIATNAPMSFTRNNFEIVDESGKNLGSLHINYKKVVMDITCFRSETYDFKSVYPKIDKYLNDEELDAKRRDFTINAIYLDVTNNNLVDPFNGLNDLLSFKLVLIGEPNLRIKEDPTRILRGLRLAYKMNFEIEANTKKAFIDNKDELKRLTSNKINTLIEKMVLDLGNKKTKKVLDEYLIGEYYNDNQ